MPKIRGCIRRELIAALTLCFSPMEKTTGWLWIFPCTHLISTENASTKAPGRSMFRCIIACIQPESTIAWCTPPWILTGIPYVVRLASWPLSWASPRLPASEVQHTTAYKWREWFVPALPMTYLTLLSWPLSLSLQPRLNQGSPPPQFWPISMPHTLMNSSFRCNITDFTFFQLHPQTLRMKRCRKLLNTSYLVGPGGDDGAVHLDVSPWRWKCL